MTDDFDDNRFLSLDDILKINIIKQKIFRYMSMKDLGYSYIPAQSTNSKGYYSAPPSNKEIFERAITSAKIDSDTKRQIAFMLDVIEKQDLITRNSKRK